MALVIGMNSGSSFDGIDAVLFDIAIGEDGQPTRPRFRDGLAYPWPREVEERVLRLFDNQLSVFDLVRLNYVAGAVYAEAAQALIDQTGVDPTTVTCIGVDGQTIYQEPTDRPGIQALPPGSGMVARWLDGPYACGLQIGESAIIAAHTGIPIVNHFRPADHALGGTGAPLMQYLDWVAFRHDAPVLTLNIGGIANCHLAMLDRADMRAFDTGPGNVMIDHATRRLFGKAYDPDGSIAASGSVHEPMIADLLTHSFYARKPPRSAWRLDFGSSYADGLLERYSSIAPEDVVATLTRFTAISIDRAIRDHIHDIGSVPVLIASGGGTRNKTLMANLGELLPPTLRLTTSTEYGIPAQYKEAIKFGTLGFANMHLLANNIPACSGATGFSILGKVAWPPSMVRVTPTAGESLTLPADCLPAGRPVS